MVDSALTGVDAGIAPRPEIQGNSVPVVPPGISDAVQIERCEIAIVLTEEWKERNGFSDDR